MNRETRKANLRKLQLPGTGGAIRKTQSCQALSTETTDISRYFSTQLPDKLDNEHLPIAQKETKENPVAEIVKSSVIENGNEKTEKTEKPKRMKRTKLTTFLYKDSKEIPVKQHAKNCDFEKDQKRVKSAPKVKTKTNEAAKRNKTRTSKRQQDIKSAFLRNEQLFSEITAQHCLADNFNPDEMQLALAMSKSEAERSGIINLEEDEDIVLDIATNDSNVEESIRTKLRRYGFRTAPKEEFSSITAAFFAGTNSRKKSKWANKFTALTVRNSEQQLKKINAKIDEFLAKQCFTKILSGTESHVEPYQVNSAILKRIKPVQLMELFKKAENFDTAELNNFYIEKLFQISRVGPGHLLKDWTSIQGRDLSPSRRSTQQNNNDAKFLRIYMELEAYFCEKTILEEKGENKDLVKVGIETAVSPRSCDNSECELDEMVELINNITSQTNNKIKIVELNSDNNSPNKEPPEKKLKPDISIDSQATEHNNDSLTKKLIEKCLPTQTQNNWVENKDTISFPKDLKQPNRATSPDIFATSDVETDEDIILAEIAEEHDVIHNSIKKCNGIEIFEKYSSNEVKTSQLIGMNNLKEDNAKTSVPVMIVDLTQEDSNPATTLPKASFEISPSKNEFEIESHLSNQILNENKLEQRTIANNSSFEFEGLRKKFNGLNSPRIDSKDEISSFEATDDTIFEALQRKYFGSGGCTAKSKQKSISMTQINQPRNSLNKSKRHLSFTQMEQQIMCSVEDVSPTKNIIFTTPTKEEKSFFNYLNKVSSPSDKKFPQHLNSNAITPNKHKTKSSTDLTQNGNSEDEFIILSDDEINYSIWKADKTMNPLSGDRSAASLEDLTSSDSDVKSSNAQENINKITHNLIDVAISSKSNHSEATSHDFSYLDLLDLEKSLNAKETAGNVSCTQACLNLDVDADNEPIQTQYLTTQSDLDLCPHTPETPKLMDLSEERAEFGILECYSEPFSETQFKSAEKQIETINASYLDSPSETTAPMKRYRNSTSSQKFNELLKSVTSTQANTSPRHLVDYDEFDRLVFGTPKLKSPQKPIGFEQLLTAEISFHEERQEKCYTTPKKLYVSPSKNAFQKVTTPMKTTEELQIDGKTYSVRVATTPKPDFTKQTDAEILKQLYNFGIKPLKRGQALKMLEYIYNQTHPILVNENQPCEDSSLTPTISQKVDTNTFEDNLEQFGSKHIVQENNEKIKTLRTNKFNLSDCCGDLLLRHRYLLNAELYNEEYVFQTNVSKRISQALLPLHVAWYNLVCSNIKLHEAILMYEPIDLQEVYAFFKILGYRYDPKDLKTFFDRRCIIFRYDLTQPGTNRHVRKQKKKTNK